MTRKLECLLAISGKFLFARSLVHFLSFHFGLLGTNCISLCLKGRAFATRDYFNSSFIFFLGSRKIDLQPPNQQSNLTIYYIDKSVLVENRPLENKIHISAPPCNILHVLGFYYNKLGFENCPKITKIGGFFFQF